MKHFILCALWLLPLYARCEASAEATDGNSATASGSLDLQKQENEALMKAENETIAGAIAYHRQSGNSDGVLNDAFSIMSSTQMAVFLDELSYQLGYAKSACASPKNCDSVLFKDATEYAAAVGRYPYHLTYNLGFFDTLRRIHSLLFLMVDSPNGKNEFLPIAQRLTPLLSKESHHLMGIARVYEETQLNHVEELIHSTMKDMGEGQSKSRSNTAPQ